MKSHLDGISDWEARALAAHFKCPAFAKACGSSERHLRRYLREKYAKATEEFLHCLRCCIVRRRLLAGESPKALSLDEKLGLHGDIARLCHEYRREFGKSPHADVLNHQPASQKLEAKKKSA